MSETKYITIDELISLYTNSEIEFLGVVRDIIARKQWDNKEKSTRILNALSMFGSVEATFYSLITKCDKDDGKRLFLDIQKQCRKPLINMIPNIEDMLKDKNIFFDPEKLEQEDKN
ncbi:MAG: hypothetical protein IJQ63_07620 [Synergistaceae bacterium]|nr:hypothetical protein [Synergistaceae bacterium]MBR0221624.1 hypothetical protein [Synergistaceae bacterium]